MCINFCIDRIENIMGKKANYAGYQHFSPHVSKSFFLVAVKTDDCLLTLYQTIPGFYVSAV